MGSIDAIITALYAVISGPVGQARDWNRMRSLFVPGGRLMPTGARAGGAIVFSTYEGRTQTDSTVIRGINSIQLMNDGTRWWVVSVFWEAEGPTNPLPQRYLRSEP